MQETIRRPYRFAALALAAVLGAQTLGAVQGEETRMQHAKGEFDVKVAPLPLDGPAEDAKLGRLSIVKSYRGGLEAAAHGQMLTGDSGVEGSAVYVAVEKVTGTLDGRKGSFLLSHRGVMTRGTPSLSIEVVPDSGSGELVGLTGTLHITIEAGKHFYDLEYNLPAAP